MPTWNEHLQKALHNEELLAFLATASPVYADWQIVLLFYTCLHYADGALAQWHIHPLSHVERTNAVQVRFPTIFLEYRVLRDLSQEARYGTRLFSASDVEMLYQIVFARVRSYELTSNLVEIGSEQKGAYPSR